MLAMDGTENVRLDIPSLAATIKTKLKESPHYSQRRCIYRVPNRLRRTNEQTYTPALVSIGPLHHNDERFVPMKAQKLKYLQSFLGGDSVDEDLLNKCLEIVKAQETQIHECYADPIDLSSEQFCEMVLTDSAFIIQYFRYCVYDDIIHKEDDYVYGNLCMETTVFRDIQLEENQLPFFILDQLYNVAFQTNATVMGFAAITCSFTELACKVLFRKREVSANADETKYYHLLHLVACHHNPAETDEPSSDSVNQSLLSSVQTSTTTEANKLTIKDFLFPQATRFDEANVKFEAYDEKSSSLLDVKYDRGVLRMTKFFVDEDTECIHRNLIAFEQCHYHYGGKYHRYFTDYHMFLNTLVNTPEDVQLLAEEGIIQNMVGSHEQVCDLINSLDTHAFTDFRAYHYQKTCVDLKDHCNNRWNRYRAMLIHDYFSNPWAAISLFAAIILLLLTIAGVVAAFLAL